MKINTGGFLIEFHINGYVPPKCRTDASNRYECKCFLKLSSNEDSVGVNDFGSYGYYKQAIEIIDTSIPLLSDDIDRILDEYLYGIITDRYVDECLCFDDDTISFTCEFLDPEYHMNPRMIMHVKLAHGSSISIRFDLDKVKEFRSKLAEMIYIE